MQESATYSQLKELFEEHFSNNSSTFNKDEFISLLIGETTALKKLSEASNIPIKDLNAFRTDCIEFLADEHYNEALLDAFVKLVIDSEPFKTHISFLEELNTGVQSLERTSRLNELKDLEDSIEASELKAVITSIERNELLEQLKSTEAKLEESEVRMHASSAYMYDVEELNIPSSRNIFSNRSMFLRIAAILLLVLIPTSIIIYFNNSNPVTTPQQIQTAAEDKKKDIMADPDLKNDVRMGSSPSLSSPNKTKIPDARIEKKVFPIIDQSIGVSRSIGSPLSNDSVFIEYHFFEAQNEYIQSQTDILKAEIIKLDSALSSESFGIEGDAGKGSILNDQKNNLKALKEELTSLDSTYMQNKLKSNVYEFKNEKLTFYIYCSECLSFDPGADDIQVIKEMDNLFLMINEESKILIEEGIHDFQFE